ncbi:Plastocyanin [Candidatus Gugararchaeum adminiculabundum]|nr:Plastocyanin [Candidatus Gugararchaeum adminiculabundum]
METMKNMESPQKAKNLQKIALVFTFVLVLLFSFGCAGASNSGNGNTSAQPAANSSVPADSSAALEVTIEIKNFAFSPASIEVKAGTKVTWINQDSAAHTVAGDSGEFQLGPLAQGEKASQVFSKTGTFAYHCGIHPSMKGTITVS